MDATSSPTAPTEGDGPLRLEDIIPDYQPANATAPTVFGKVGISQNSIGMFVIFIALICAGFLLIKNVLGVFSCGVLKTCNV